VVYEASRDLLAGGPVGLGVLQRNVPGRVDGLRGYDAVRPAGRSCLCNRPPGVLPARTIPNCQPGDQPCPSAASGGSSPRCRRSFR
jgi:hypothetical protein